MIANDLLPLLQEIQALGRAGIPLPTGLRSLAADGSGKFGRLANELAERLERGQSLEQAVREASPQERMVTAVLAAGQRSGNPARALEGLIEVATRYQSLRQILWAEMSYPLFILLLGYVTVSFTLRKITPVIFRASQNFDAENAGTAALLRAESWLVASDPLLFYIVLGIGGLLVFWVIRSLSVKDAGSGGFHVFGRVRRSYALARFFDLLALMVEQRVPLTDALQLAGEGAGGKALATAAAKTSEQLQRAEHPTAISPLPQILPWLLQSSSTRQLVDLLHREASHYRRRGEHASRWALVGLPLSLSLIVGLTFVLIMIFVNLAPFLNLLYRLSRFDNG